jgi:hypothetical protein
MNAFESGFSVRSRVDVLPPPELIHPESIDHNSLLSQSLTTEEMHIRTSLQAKHPKHWL